MHARVSTIEMDSDRIDDAVKEIEQGIIPTLKDTDGFKGLTVGVDRDGGKVIGVAYWDSEEAMKAAETAGNSARKRAAEAGGATSPPKVERFAVAIDTFMP
jgi:heme-degrading monooxygenase HmoA